MTVVSQKGLFLSFLINNEKGGVIKRQRMPNRWVVVVGAILIQQALGDLYAWSVYTKILTDPAGIYG